MRIVTGKIPLKFTNLIKLVEFINNDDDNLLTMVIDRLSIMEGSPDQSNATFKQFAVELKRQTRALYGLRTIHFCFYTSRNYFIGHNVISHANKGNVINYNTRFHSVKTFQTKDWIRNFFHELTHLVDQSSIYSFSHESQKDIKTAPFVIGNLAAEIYEQKYLIESPEKE